MNFYQLRQKIRDGAYEGNTKEKTLEMSFLFVEDLQKTLVHDFLTFGPFDHLPEEKRKEKAEFTAERIAEKAYEQEKNLGFHAVANAAEQLYDWTQEIIIMSIK